MRAHRLTLLVSLFMLACRSTTAPEGPEAPALSAEPLASVRADSGSVAARAATEMFVHWQGACEAPGLDAVGTLPVQVMPKAVWAFDKDEPRALYRLTYPQDRIDAAGGVDEAHMWVWEMFPSRGDVEVHVVLMKNKGWKSLSVGSKNTDSYGYDVSSPPRHMQDGTMWADGEHDMFNEPGAPLRKLMAWSASGDLLSMKLPGADLWGGKRLENGEFLAPDLSKSKKPVLRRWSPVKRVDDLVLESAPASSKQPGLLVGKARAVLSLDEHGHAFYNYIDEKLVPSPINERAAEVESWLLPESDELMVTTKAGQLLIDRGGVLQEERLPEAGSLRGNVTPYLQTATGKLYARTSGAWTEVVLPTAPWDDSSYGPVRITDVREVAGETFVVIERTGQGFGAKKPVPIRTVYSSKQHPVLRCGAPFADFGALPKAAGAECNERVVLIGREGSGAPPKTYPKIAAALKGDAALGETLAFVNFGPAKGSLLGIVAPSAEIAASLREKLAKVASHAPEVLCGVQDERRRLTFTVKTGTFQ